MGRSDAAIWLLQTTTGDLEQAIARGHFLGLECKKIIPGNHILGEVINQDKKDHSEFSKNTQIIKELGGCYPPDWNNIILPIRAGTQTVGYFLLHPHRPDQLMKASCIFFQPYAR